jgi:tRNA pseudouridine38-40 synthase
MSSYGVLLTVAYDGQNFAGFARQPGQRTVAGELDGAVVCIDANATKVRGASRTDAGVHARGQLVAFDTEKQLSPRSWALALTAQLPSEIAIVRAALVEPGLEPRHLAVRKRYRYVIFESKVRDPFLEGRAWRVDDRLNHDAMLAEAAELVGEHDFRAFRAAGDERPDTVRRLFRAEVRSDPADERCLDIVIEGDRFLYRMMRIIVGTLVDVGRQRLTRGAISRALGSLSRTDLGITAPPHGLYLEEVELATEPSDAWPANIDGTAPVA